MSEESTIVTTPERDFYNVPGWVATSVITRRSEFLEVYRKRILSGEEELKPEHAGEILRMLADEMRKEKRRIDDLHGLVFKLEQIEGNARKAATAAKNYIAGGEPE